MFVRSNIPFFCALLFLGSVILLDKWSLFIETGEKMQGKWSKKQNYLYF